VSALTQLMHEGPRSSVNMYDQSALGTNVGGLGHVQSTSQSRLKQMDSHSPGLAVCPLQAVLVLL